MPSKIDWDRIRNNLAIRFPQLELELVEEIVKTISLQVDGYVLSMSYELLERGESCLSK